MKTLCRTGLLLLTLCLPVLAGCNFDNAVPMTGAVTYEGQPVKEGQIVFTDPSGDTKSGAGAIVDGSYNVTVAPGNKTVRITAFRETGRMDRSNPGVEKPEIEAYIPEKYNARSTLNITVESSGGTRDFALEK